MGQIDIPIVNGMDESWDDKLLPEGAISSADNIVIEKNGQAKARGGFREESENSISSPKAPAPAGGILSQPTDKDDLTGYWVSDGERLNQLAQFNQLTVEAHGRLSSAFGSNEAAVSVFVDGSLYLITLTNSLNVNLEKLDGVNYEPSDSWVLPVTADALADPKDYFPFVPVDVAIGPEGTQVVITYQGYNGGTRTNTFGLYYGEGAQFALIVDLPGSIPPRLGVIAVTEAKNSSPFFPSDRFYSYPVAFTAQGSLFVGVYYDEDVSSFVARYVRSIYDDLPVGNVSYIFSSNSNSLARDWDTVESINGDNSGRVWLFRDGFWPEYWQFTGGTIPTSNAEVLDLKYIPDPVDNTGPARLCFDGLALKGIYRGERDYWEIEEFAAALGSYKRIPYSGISPSGGLVYTDDGIYFIGRRSDNVSDAEVSTQVGESTSPFDMVAFNNANRQGGVYELTLADRSGDIQLVAPLQSSNIVGESYLANNGSQLCAIYRSGVLSASEEIDARTNYGYDQRYSYKSIASSMFKTVLKPWNRRAVGIRKSETFFPGASDLFTDSARVVFNSFVAPPYVQGFGNTGTWFADRTDIRAGELLLGNWAMYVVLEFTDNNGRVHRSQPSFLRVPLTISYESKVYDSDQPTTYGFTAQALLPTPPKLLVTLPSYQDTTITARVYTQELDYSFITGQNGDDDGSLFAKTRMDKSLDQNTRGYREIVSGIGEGGETIEIAIPALARKAGQADCLEPFELQYGDFLYTNGEVANDHGPSGEVIAETRTRVFRTAYPGSDTIYASKFRQTGRGVEWSELDTFKIFMKGEVTGLAGMDTQLLVLTRHGVYNVSGNGPTNGGQGTFNTPSEIPGISGCISKESVVETPQGIFFQSDRGIYRISRGFESPVWKGENIRETLTPDHVCTGSSYLPSNERVSWTFLKDGEMLLIEYDIRKGQWYKGTLDECGDGEVKIIQSELGNEAVTTYAVNVSNEKSQLLKYHEDETDGYECELVTGELRMAGIDGHWAARNIYILGEKLGDVDVTISLAFNSQPFGEERTSQTYSLEEFTDMVQLKLTPPIKRFDSMKIKVSWPSKEGGSFILNGITVYYDEFQEGSRLGKRSRG